MRGSAGASPSHDFGKQLIQQFLVLELSQAGRVRRTDVDDKKIGSVAERMDRGRIILASVRQIHVAVFSDVDTDQDAVRWPWDARRDGVRAVIVESHPVNEGALFNLAKKSWSLSAGLRTRGHAADLRKAKPKRGPQFQAKRVLVIARGETDGIWKLDAENRLAQ